MPIKRNLDSLIASSINSNVNGQQSSTNFDIEGLFKPTYGKDGTFEVWLRFLPPVAAEDSQYIENRAHWLKQTGGQKSIAINCLKRFKEPGSNKGMPCPVCDYNNKMWGLYGDKVGKTGKHDEYSAHKLPTARPEYMCNILVVRNDNQPSTEGQVFRFKYSKQIKEKIDNAINDTGKYDDNGEPIPPINPYSYYGPTDKEVISGEVRSGAIFVFKGKPGDYGTSYEDSHFNKASRIGRAVDATNSLGQTVKKIVPYTDAEIDEIESRLYTLKEFEDTLEKAKTYDQTIEYVKNKTSIDLRPTLGIAQASNEDSYVATTAKQTIQSVESDDDEMFAGTPLETKKTEAVKSEPIVDETVVQKTVAAETSTPKTAEVKSQDEDSFFSDLFDEK